MRGTVSWPEEEASDAMCICDVHASFQTFRSVLLRFQPKQLHGRTMHALLAGSLNRSAHQPYKLGAMISVIRMQSTRVCQNGVKGLRACTCSHAIGQLCFPHASLLL